VTHRRASLRGGLLALTGLFLGLQVLGTARAQTPDPLAKYRLAAVNAGNEAITAIYMRAAGATSWGPNLVSSPLGANQRVTLPPDPEMGCQRDVYVRYAGGTHSDKLNLNICAFATTNFAGPTVPAGGASLSMTVKNVGTPAMIGFYVIPKAPGGVSLGSNRLSGSLTKGQSAHITLDATHCVFDMEAIYAGTIREYRQRVNLCAQDEQLFAGPEMVAAAPVPAAPVVAAPPTQPAAPSQPAPEPAPPLGAQGQPAATDIYVVNHGKDTIVRAAFRRSFTSEPLTDQLSAPLAPGQRQLVHLPPGAGCIYDIVANYRNGGNSQQLRLNICGYSDAVFASPEPGRAASGAPASLLMRNAAKGAAIRGLYLSPSNAQTTSFGPNRLRGTLAAGQSITIPLPLAGESAHCDYDIRAIYVAGVKEDRYRVNICEIGGQVFNGPGSAPPPGAAQ